MSADILHAWVYVIIPVERGRTDGNGWYTGSVALFSAFCKQCRMYYTEPIPWDKGPKGHAVTTPSGLPRAGCNITEPLGVEGLG